MTSRFPLLLLALGLFLGGACSSDPAEPHRSNGVLAGSVGLVKSGEGVRDIIAVLLRDGHVVAAEPTDALGTFRFTDVSAGQYTVRLTGLELSAVSLRHTAFDPVWQDVRVNGAPVDIVFAGVGLVPARILGDVTCDAAPLAGVTLRVVGGTTDVSVQTNAQGRYAATDLDPGHYTVLLPTTTPNCRFAAPWSVTEVLVGQSVEVDFNGSS